jgi:septum formation inhibitor-activating ATPase MinD
MGNEVKNHDSHMVSIKAEIDLVLKVLDTIDPETAGVEEIDRIIGMLDELEAKCRQVRENWD